jgi:hypothetical protein
MAAYARWHSRELALHLTTMIFFLPSFATLFSLLLLNPLFDLPLRVITTGHKLFLNVVACVGHGAVACACRSAGLPRTRAKGALPSVPKAPPVRLGGTATG